MAGFSESLTVQILADSSQFSSELDRVISRMNSWNRQLEQMGRGQQQLTSLARRIGALNTPLSRVSGMLKRVAGQIRQVSGMSISVNVSPAMGAIARMSAAISRVAGQLRAFAGGGGVGIPRGNTGGGGILPAPGFLQGPRQGFASGGMVSGLAGNDRIPAMLTAGEFVLQRSAVEQLGGSFLESLNRSGTESQPSLGSDASLEKTVNQFGEISIHVSESVDLNEIVSDLQFAGHRMRNRRG